MGMSVTLCVNAVKPADKKFKKMKAVWEACKAADMDVPDEVEEYFGCEGPLADGVTVPLGSCYGDYAPDADAKKHDSVVRVISDEGDGWTRYGFEVDITKLPKDATRFIVYVSGSY